MVGLRREWIKWLIIVEYIIRWMNEKLYKI